MLLSPGHELWKGLEVTKQSSQPGHFIKLRDLTCARWGGCVCSDTPLLTPKLPSPQFIVTWTHWHQTTAKPFQAYRCTTAKQRAGWMTLVHRQGITDVCGGQRHKIWGERSRKTDVRCRMSPQSPHRGKWIQSGSAEIPTGKRTSSLNFYITYGETWLHHILCQNGGRTAWYQEKLETKDGIPNHVDQSAFLCQVKVSRISISRSISTILIWTEQSCHKWQDRMCKHMTVVPGEWFMLRFSLPCIGCSPIIVLWAPCIWLLLLVETPCDWNTK